MSVAAATVHDMSLTSVLSNGSSPFRRLMAAELPDVAAVRAGYRARRPVGLDVVRPNPPDGTTPAWGTLGAAIDHRIRCMLSDARPTGGAVDAGVGLVDSPRMNRPAPVAGALRGSGVALLRKIERMFGERRPFDRARRTPLLAHDEEQLDRLCVVAAWFEEIYRSGRLWPGTPLGDAGADVTLDALLAAVPPYMVSDLATMAGLAHIGLADVRASCEPADVLVGPTFTGSRDVGGADADWIAAGLLADVKSTARTDKLAADDVYQLASYALLDYDDRYGIERVGWYLARLGWLVTWDLDEFFGLLGASYSVSELRHRVAEVLSR